MERDEEVVGGYMFQILSAWPVPEEARAAEMGHTAREQRGPRGERDLGWQRPPGPIDLWAVGERL